MFARLIAGLLAKESRSSSPPSVQTSVDEAAQNYLGKQAKLETAIDSVFVHDARELAAADREKVRRYEEQKLFGGRGKAQGKGDDDVGDFIVCDDYRVNNWLPWTVVALIGAGLLALFAFLYPAMQSEPEPQPDRFGVYDIDKFIPTDDQKTQAFNGDN